MFDCIQESKGHGDQSSDVELVFDCCDSTSAEEDVPGPTASDALLLSEVCCHSYHLLPYIFVLMSVQCVIQEAEICDLQFSFIEGYPETNEVFYFCILISSHIARACKVSLC